MVLEVPNGLFQQRDVRETATETAATKDSTFVVLSSEVENLPNSKILAVSTGLDIGTTATQVYFSLEKASETNLGGATFDGDDFTVTAGDVTLKNKTSYVSVPPASFHATNPDTDTCHISNGVKMVADATVTFWAPVQIPNGAIITDVIVYGSETDELWWLERIAWTGNSTTAVANGNFETADTGLSHTVDNSAGAYQFKTASLDATDEIWGAKITYTTDYD